MDQETFDQKLAGVVSDLQTQIGVIKTTVQAIIDKIASAGGKPVDLTAEAATLDSIQQGIDGIATSLPTTPTPPPTTGP